MRTVGRRASHEEDEESAFVSMTDLTLGFLFIVMLLRIIMHTPAGLPDVERVKERLQGTMS